MAKNRLSKDDWIAAGFRALSENGPAALKAEPLARGLGTTKGSFYWHFDDVPSFQSAMLSLWEQRAFHDITRLLDEEANPIKRLRALGDLAAQPAPEEFGGPAAEPAVRAWARENPIVQEAVDRVDAARMRYVEDLFKEMDITNPELTRVLYATFIGMSELSLRDSVDNGPAMGTLVDLILALYEDS